MFAKTKYIIMLKHLFALITFAWFINSCEESSVSTPVFSSKYTKATLTNQDFSVNSIYEFNRNTKTSIEKYMFFGKDKLVNTILTFSYAPNMSSYYKWFFQNLGNLTKVSLMQSYDNFYYYYNENGLLDKVVKNGSTVFEGIYENNKLSEIRCAVGPSYNLVTIKHSYGTNGFVNKRTFIEDGEIVSEQEFFYDDAGLLKYYTDNVASPDTIKVEFEYKTYKSQTIISTSIVNYGLLSIYAYEYNALGQVIVDQYAESSKSYTNLYFFNFESYLMRIESASGALLVKWE